MDRRPLQPQIKVADGRSQLCKSEGRWFFSLAIGGLLARMALATQGHNWDMEMIFKIGSTPAGTHFYSAFPWFANWGPLGYWAFQLICQLPSGDDIHSFRYYCAALFSLCDLTTGWVAWRVWGLRAAALFIFAPAAMVISGYHCNAEPAVLAAAALGIYAHLRKAEGNEREPTSVWLYVLLGISMSVKHVFVFFPLWLAFGPLSWSERVRCWVASYGTWWLILSPFLITDPTSVIRNVFLYNSTPGNGVIPLLAVSALDAIGVEGSFYRLYRLWLPLMLAAMIGVGWFLRNRNVVTIFLLYPIALVSLSAALAPQYFATTSLGLGVLGGTLNGAFQIVSAVVLATHPNELHLFALPATLQDRAFHGIHYHPGLVALQGLLLIFLVLSLRRIRRSNEPEPVPQRMEL